MYSVFHYSVYTWAPYSLASGIYIIQYSCRYIRQARNICFHFEVNFAGKLCIQSLRPLCSKCVHMCKSTLYEVWANFERTSCNFRSNFKQTLSQLRVKFAKYELRMVTFPRLPYVSWMIHMHAWTQLTLEYSTASRTHPQL